MILLQPHPSRILTSASWMDNAFGGIKFVLYVMFMSNLSNLRSRFVFLEGSDAIVTCLTENLLRGFISIRCNYLIENRLRTYVGGFQG
jgi:hypothetical protein